jgi:hypothetical protein
VTRWLTSRSCCFALDTRAGLSRARVNGEWQAMRLPIEPPVTSVPCSPSCRGVPKVTFRSMLKLKVPLGSLSAKRAVKITPVRGHRAGGGLRCGRRQSLFSFRC